MAVLGLVATARVNGILANYLVRWWWVVALLLWLAIGWCLVEALRGLLTRPHANGSPARGRGLGRLAPVAGFLVATGTLVLVAVSSADALPAPLPVAPASDTIAHLAPSTARAVGRDGPYLLSWEDPEALSGVGPGMFTTLRLAGVDVVAGPEESMAVGAWRVAPPIRVNGVITGVGVPDPTILSQPLQPSPASRLVASYDPLSPGQRQEAVTLQRRIRAELGPRAPADPLVVSQVPHDADDAHRGRRLEKRCAAPELSAGPRKSVPRLLHAWSGVTGEVAVGLAPCPFASSCSATCRLSRARMAPIPLSRSDEMASDNPIRV